ncbi:hypothetical protein PROFUN_14171 [Planoprotostelium fungivorum]|uniref:Uncharacterized protein n=1 Tax=Planoprotostelium fungivorum TaxID=1890364 RepID=A0A2P6N1B8_9EUKA|nr:hypothetical protein PROFUN_14171 [Planoprotostelium fungivorum]
MDLIYENVSLGVLFANDANITRGNTTLQVYGSITGGDDAALGRLISGEEM